MQSSYIFHQNIKADKVIDPGLKDERCYQNGHDWDDPNVYYWVCDKGYARHCPVCGRIIVTNIYTGAIYSFMANSSDHPDGK